MIKIKAKVNIKNMFAFYYKQNDYYRTLSRI